MLPLGAEPENNVLDDNSHTATTLGSMPRTPGRNQSVRGVSIRGARATGWESQMGGPKPLQPGGRRNQQGEQRGLWVPAACAPVPSLASPGQSRWDFA